MNIEEHIPVFLKMVQDRAGSGRKKNGIQCITLFVEGKIDNRLYKIIGGNKIASPFKTPLTFDPIWQFKEIEQTIKVSASWINDYRAHEFVIDSVDGYKGKCYGIIDNDLNKHEGEDQCRALAITETHDQETMLVLCYMDTLYQQLVKQYAIKDAAPLLLAGIIKVIHLTVHQGILEHTSIQWENSDFKDITHTYFIGKDDKKIYGPRRMYNTGFDSEIEHAIQEYGYRFGKAYINQFLNAYQSHCNMETDLLTALDDQRIIQKWLCEGLLNLDSDEIALIQKMCWYINGHLFFQQLALCINDVLVNIKYRDEEYTEDRIGNQLIELFKKDPQLYYQYNPITKCKRDLSATNELVVVSGG